MPVYNGERYVHDAVKSILTQSFRDFEFLIIDDGSTDTTPRILEAYAKGDRRIRLIANERNIGLTRSLNAGIEQARGKYLARQDADDISEASRILEQVRFLDRHPEVVFVGTQHAAIDEEGHVIGHSRHPLENSDLAQQLVFRNAFTHGSVMIRDPARARYDEALETTQDYELWCRLLSAGQAANLDKTLYRLRLHGARVSERRCLQQEKLHRQVAQDYVRRLLEDGRRTILFGAAVRYGPTQNLFDVLQRSVHGLGSTGISANERQSSRRILAGPSVGSIRKAMQLRPICRAYAGSAPTLLWIVRVTLRRVKAHVSAFRKKS